MLKTIQEIQHTFLDKIIHRNRWIGLDKRAEEFVRLFEGNLSPGSKILDIGAGPGLYHEPLTARGHEVVLLDVKKFDSCPYPILLYDGKKIPLDDKSIDVSLLITVLHHTPNPEAILKEAKRVSRQRVIVIEDVYDGKGGEMLTKLRDATLNLEFFGHPMNFRSYRRWKNIFERLGFSLIAEKDFASYVLKIPIRTGMYILQP